MKKPKPLAGNNPGLKKGPSKNQARAPQKPHYMGAVDAVRDIGHDVEDRGRKIGKRVVDAIDKLNPFD